MKIPEKFAPVFYVAVILFLGTLSFVASTSDRFPGDLEISIWVQSWRTPWLDTLMEKVSLVGSFVPLMIALLFVAGVLVWVRRAKAAALLLAATIVGSLANWGLKLAIERPRPSPELVWVLHEEGGLSFPSGHAMQITIFLGILMFLVPMYVQNMFMRWGLNSLLAVLILITGLSRIYLGAHWLSDVLGGYVFGLAFLFVIGLSKSKQAKGFDVGGDGSASLLLELRPRAPQRRRSNR